jgi:hypothetical protein
MSAPLLSSTVGFSDNADSELDFSARFVRTAFDFCTQYRLGHSAVPFDFVLPTISCPCRFGSRISKIIRIV